MVSRRSTHPSPTNGGLIPTGDDLAKLNAEQRQAAEHGAPLPQDASPLLIIAGAGSGKTNTLAHVGPAHCAVSLLCV